MSFREKLQLTTISALVAAVVVTAGNLWAQDETVTYRAALALGQPLDPEYGGVPPGAVIFVTTARCPEGYAEYATARGRYVVGLPRNGTRAGTSGDPLSNLQVRRGGTAHAGPSLSAISVSDDFSVSYTRPTVSYARPTVSYARPTVNHQHTHAYTRMRIVSTGQGTLAGQGSRILRQDDPQSSGHSAAPVVAGGRVSLSAGGVSISGGGVSLGVTSRCAAGRSRAATPATSRSRPPTFNSSRASDRHSRP